MKNTGSNKHCIRCAGDVQSVVGSKGYCNACNGIVQVYSTYTGKVERLTDPEITLRFSVRFRGLLGVH